MRHVLAHLVCGVLPLTFLALGSAACGGSGGGSGDGGGAALDGSYQAIVLRRDVAGDRVRSTTAVYAADGQGLLTGVEAWSRDAGALVGPFAPEDLTFSVDASRSLVLSGLATPTLTGRVAADGSVAALTSTAAGADPCWMVLTRRRTDVTLADVVGEWWWMQWTHQPLNGTTKGYAAMGEAQILTDGRLVYRTWTYNDDGQIDPVPALFSASTVTFPGGGAVLADADVNVQWRGGLSADGNLLLLAVADGAGAAWASVAVLVRRGDAQDVSDLAGDHGVYGFQSVGTPFACTFGTLSVPGTTGGSWTFAGNRDGTILASSVRPLDAFVWVSGEVRLDVATASPYRGGLAPDGRFGAVSGNFSAGGHPTTLFWVR
jgi:hypothetical protein